MDKTVLEELVEKLSDRYGSGRHFEIIYADKKCDSTWSLVVREVENEKGIEKERE